MFNKELFFMNEYTFRVITATFFQFYKVIYAYIHNFVCQIKHKWTTISYWGNRYRWWLLLFTTCKYTITLSLVFIIYKGNFRAQAVTYSVKILWLPTISRTSIAKDCFQNLPLLHNIFQENFFINIVEALWFFKNVFFCSLIRCLFWKISFVKSDLIL